MRALYFCKKTTVLMPLTYVGTVASQGRVFAHVHLPVCHSSMDVSLCTHVWVRVYMCLFRSLQYVPCVPALLISLCLCALRGSQIQRCSVLVCRILLNELLLNSLKVKVRTCTCPYMHVCICLSRCTIYALVSW